MIHVGVYLLVSKEEKVVKPRFLTKDGKPGPGRLFARKGEDPKDAKKRLSEKYKIPAGTPFDKGTNSFVPKGRDAAFKPKKSKEALPGAGTPGDDKADYIDSKGKKWLLEKDEDLATLKVRAEASYKV